MRITEQMRFSIKNTWIRLARPAAEEAVFAEASKRAFDLLKPMIDRMYPREDIDVLVRYGYAHKQAADSLLSVTYVGVSDAGLKPERIDLRLPEEIVLPQMTLNLSQEALPEGLQRALEDVRRSGVVWAKQRGRMEEAFVGALSKCKTIKQVQAIWPEVLECVPSVARMLHIGTPEFDPASVTVVRKGASVEK